MRDEPISPTGPALYSRERFESTVSNARVTHRRQSWILAGSSLLFGALLLALISATQSLMGRTAHLILTLLLFLAYLAVMGVMLLSTRLRALRLRPHCPHCDTPLDLLAEQVALETGACNACGERVIE